MNCRLTSYARHYYIYYKIVHVVQNNEKYRRHKKIKGNVQQTHNLYQLSLSANLQSKYNY